MKKAYKYKNLYIVEEHDEVLLVYDYITKKAFRFNLIDKSQEVLGDGINLQLIRQKIIENLVSSEDRRYELSINPHSVLNKVPSLCKIMKFILLYAAIPIFIVSLLTSWHSITDFIYTGVKMDVISIVIIIIGSVIVSGILHEVAHAVFSYVNGAYALEMGIKFNFVNDIPIPTFYTSTIGLGYIDKKQNIQVLLAGILMHYLLAGVSLRVSSIMTVAQLSDIF